MAGSAAGEVTAQWYGNAGVRARAGAVGVGAGGARLDVGKLPRLFSRVAKAPELRGFYDGWADQQQKLFESLRPLTLEQVQLRPAPGEWAIWQLASNMAGGRLYWLCHMLGEDDRGLSQMFRVDHTTVPGLALEWAGWEDNEDRPRSAGELIEAFEKTWEVVDACLERWTLEDLGIEVTSTDAWGQPRTITRGGVLWRLMAHEVHHGSEISLILRVHGLPTAINR